MECILRKNRTFVHYSILIFILGLLCFDFKKEFLLL